MSSGKQSEDALSQLIPVLDRIACAIEKLADQPASSSTRDTSPAVSKQAEAMVWAVTYQVTDVSRIADQFGVTPRTVRRWPKLRQLLDGLKLEVSKGDPNSGYRTTDGVEAF